MIQERQMERNPPRVSRKDRTRKSSRYTVDESGGDLIECSGKYCRSCTAGLIADCVALCCCPCALLNLLTFAFVKVPWMVGRKCLGRVKKKRRKRKMKRKCKKRSEKAEAEIEGDATSISIGGERDGNLKIWELVNGFGEEVSARFEADRVWLELYEDGHLGFGRVSFTGIQ
ncbi:hypothetical protein P3X46_026210 [Hevea brasiliensis]|uniref:Transmembrane protein n=1 Tax=Hevea brasiliensis TaxID=3981 RepID=A0ABQ9KY28_HEVBR|nr:uncharacterized protein LOC110632407 [Hevea brasiliensis]KAJ9152666.1 hypothetical protein P3X46_026210 [Hevea brasiliensis]